VSTAADLHHLTGGCYAWLQPDGGWGLSNAGLITGHGASVLVDTLFDLPRTRRMLDAMTDAVAAAPIRTLVNTHGNGDHWFGNQLVRDAEIVAAAPSVVDMRAVSPQMVGALVSSPGATGDYVRRIFGGYEFTGITPTYPDRTYEEELLLTVGGVDVLLVDVGPAHTSGDTVVYCERDRVAFTGDIVFAGGTPIMWAGPVANWIAACRRIRELGAEVVVPGHGPVSPVARVQDMVDYLEFVYGEAGRRHAAGMPAQDAALDIDLGSFASWPEAERLAVNVATVYRELDPLGADPPTGAAQFGCMAELAAACAR
jgi:glyoxylase-like metal-dependent hydrolase (beta-lactamase superfamily II)